MKRRFIAALTLGLTSLAVTAQLQSVVTSNTAFALNLYRQLATNSGNLFLSPYSISSCLAMLYTGARNDTERQMSQVLGFSTNQTEFASSFGQLQTVLKADHQPDAVELDIANALWTQEGYPFLPAFLATATNQDQASINQADFVTAADVARQAINDWVAQATQGKIPAILPPGSLNGQTRLVLANAVYFKGAWTLAFAPTNTTSQTFNFSSSEQGVVSMMHQPPVSTNLYNYVETDSVQALELPYGSNQVSMVILLPTQLDGYAQIEQQLSPAFLDSVLGKMTRQSVEIYLPRFSLESSFDLNDPLANLGMLNTFDPTLADFSGIDGMTDLSVSFIRHQAWAEVDEAGTEAAAATVTGVTTSVIISTPVVRVDHPFIFFIRDRQTGSILFLGRVVKPSATGVAAPQLKIASAEASRISLSWPVSSPSFVLQACSSLENASWTTVTNATTVLGQQNQAVLPSTGGNRFYRLMNTGN